MTALGITDAITKRQQRSAYEDGTVKIAYALQEMMHLGITRATIRQAKRSVLMDGKIQQAIATQVSSSEYISHMWL